VLPHFTAAAYLTAVERKEHNDLVVQIHAHERAIRELRLKLSVVRTRARVRKSRGEAVK
jgi:hypothetical protein